MAEKNASSPSQTVKLSNCPCMKDQPGPDVIDVSGLLKLDISRSTPVSCRLPRPNQKLPTSMAIKVCCYTADIRLKISPKSRFFRNLFAVVRTDSNGTAKRAVCSRLRHTMLHESLAPHFFDSFHHNAHPMAMMCGAVGALSAFYHDVMDIRSGGIVKSRRIAWLPKCQHWQRCATSTRLGSPSCTRGTTSRTRELPLHDVWHTVRDL